MLDLPPAVHLFDDELEIHAHHDPQGTELCCGLQSGDQAAYSATLLVSMPIASLRSARMHPGRVVTTAP